MKERDGIKKITFLTGKPNQARDQAFLKRHKEAGTDLYAFIEMERGKGAKAFEQHNRELLEMVLEADDLANNDELSLSDLRNADIKLKRYLKRLNDVVYKSVTSEPEASFVTEFKVEESNGHEYVVNEGLNEKIHDLYISKIPSIQNSISIIETRIQHFAKQATNQEDEETAIPRLTRPRSILLLLHECGMLKPFYEYAENRGLKGKQMAKLLSLITGLGKEASAFRNDISSVLYDVKNSNGEYVKNEDSINALSDDVFKAIGLHLRNLNSSRNK